MEMEVGGENTETGEEKMVQDTPFAQRVRLMRTLYPNTVSPQRDRFAWVNIVGSAMRQGVAKGQ